MTNDTKAPERIWAWPTYSWLSGTWAQTRFPETAESYTRADLALAAQGALIERVEDAMQSVDQEQAEDGVMWGDMAQLSYAISNLSPDATDALEAVRREAVERASTEIATLKSKAAKQRNEIARLTQALEVATEEKRRAVDDLKWMRGEK